MKRAILLDTKLSTVTPSTRRPEDERHLSFDVQSFDQDEFELAANNSAGTNAESVRLIAPIRRFVQIYAPYPQAIEITLNGVLTLPAFNGLFILSAPLASIHPA